MCSRYLTDEVTHRPSAIDIIERVRLREDPVQLGTLAEKFRAHVVSSWRLDKESKEACTFKVRLDILDGESVVDTSGVQDLEVAVDAVSRSVFTLDFEAVPSGLFSFRVSFLGSEQEQWNVAAAIPLEIVVQSARPRAAKRKRPKRDE